MTAAILNQKNQTHKKVKKNTYLIWHKLQILGVSPFVMQHNNT